MDGFDAVGGVVRDCVHLLYDELDGLAALVRIRVDRRLHLVLQVVYQRHVLHSDHGLLFEQRLVVILRMDRVHKLLVDAEDVVARDVARLHRQSLRADVDVRVLAGEDGAVAAEQIGDPGRHAPLRCDEAVRFDVAILVHRAIHYIHASHIGIDRIRIFL